ncbi:MAG: hypothetical protein LBU51_05645 [Bacteroidales bacterium]|jgi:hypothetical protein|nr:hypothetical protein [Bacteroidales bacterium]
MKQIKLFLILGFVLLSFSACKKEPVVYNFEKKDPEKLLSNYTKNSFLAFKNELGEEKYYELIEVKQENVEYTFPGPEDVKIDCFFYELKTFHLKDIESQKIIGLYLYRFPIEVDKAMKNVYYKFRSHLMGNICNIPFEFNQKLINLEINGITYEDVVEIQNTDFQPDDYFNIKTIYYDLYSGILEMIDGDNHHWKFEKFITLLSLQFNNN